MEELRAALAARYERVAVIHEWLTIPGGSEKVLLAILDLLPHAECFTAIYDPQQWDAVLDGRPVHRTWLDRLPGARTQYPRLLPLMDSAFRRFDLRGFDLVVSSNHANAKNVRVPAGVPHVCYCHTPMRYAWDPALFADEQVGPAQRAAFRALVPWLRRVDRRGASGVDVFGANSSYVAERIRRFYGRGAAVIHPPVAVDELLARPRPPVDDDAPYLVFGRLVPYKRAGLALEACTRLGRRIRVAGAGRDLDRIRALAADNPRVELLGAVADDELPALFAGSRALLFPGVEDFGFVPVEAQAAGLPVIAYGEGGVRDSVIDGVTGVLYTNPSADGLAAAIERFETLRLDDAALRDNARRFAPGAFHTRFAELLLGAGAP
jgi:glycosyltransferase involved in cell wall biosynthesis